ncbi:hypothetical protein STEG23_032594, partial [Scotinomys teguina]
YVMSGECDKANTFLLMYTESTSELLPPDELFTSRIVSITRAIMNWKMLPEFLQMAFKLIDIKYQSMGPTTRVITQAMDIITDLNCSMNMDSDMPSAATWA